MTRRSPRLRHPRPLRTAARSSAHCSSTYSRRDTVRIASHRNTTSISPNAVSAADAEVVDDAVVVSSLTGDGWQERHRLPVNLPAGATISTLQLISIGGRFDGAVALGLSFRLAAGSGGLYPSAGGESCRRSSAGRALHS